MFGLFYPREARIQSHQYLSIDSDRSNNLELLPYFRDGHLNGLKKLEPRTAYTALEFFEEISCPQLIVPKKINLYSIC